MTQLDQAYQCVSQKSNQPGGAWPSKPNQSTQSSGIDLQVTLDYDKLAICTGATPHPLSIPGCDKHAIFYLNTLNDANRLKQYIKQHRPALRLWWEAALLV